MVVDSRPGLAAAYARAEEACRAALTPLVAEWEREVAQGRAAAEEELARYYHRSLEEEVAGLRRVFHQVAVLKVRVSLARRTATRRQFRSDLRRWEKELSRQLGGKESRAAQLAAELRRRQAEVARRYAARVEVKLVAAARLTPEDRRVGEERAELLLDRVLRSRDNGMGSAK